METWCNCMGHHRRVPSRSDTSVLSMDATITAAHLARNPSRELSDVRNGLDSLVRSGHRRGQQSLLGAWNVARRSGGDHNRRSNR